MIAERVLTLGGTPLHTFEDYIKHNKIVVGKIFQMMKKQFNFVDSLSHLLIIERAILDKSAAINDEGSNAMMSDLFQSKRKRFG
jgi:starvation-inducible DNA-binding protein